MQFWFLHTDWFGSTICIRRYTSFVLYNRCPSGAASANKITGQFHTYHSRWGSWTRQRYGFSVHYHSYAGGEKWHKQHSHCIDVGHNRYGKGNVNFPILFCQKNLLIIKLFQLFVRCISLVCWIFFILPLQWIYAGSRIEHWSTWTVFGEKSLFG